MRNISKRAFDVSMAALGLCVLFPLFIGIAAWIKLDSAGPIFFLQWRVGRFGHLFKIYKFRTMCANAEWLGPGLTTSVDPRITRAGFWLRRYKIDEWPQLLNVLCGAMSFVGPRPETPEYLVYYPTAVREILLSVRPGITSPASIYFRHENIWLANAVDPEQAYVVDILPKKQDLEEKYVRQRSFGGDIKIMMRTVYALFH